jgi:drug/metabolite transporter (DMT)-like permease
MVRRNGASRVSALFFLVPPLAALIAWGLLGESLPAGAWAGMGVAAAGVAIATRSGREAQTASERR